jgi:RNA polymerase sigma-70 factor (ECF subfamily)
MPRSGLSGDEDEGERGILRWSLAAWKSVTATPSDPEPTMQKDPFRIAYDQHVDFVWRLLRYFRIPDGERQDAAQEVFVVLADNLEKLDPGGIRPYLYGIAKHVAWKRRRWSARLASYLTRFGAALSDAGLDEGRSDPEQESASNAERQRFMRLLDKLDEHQRTAFILRNVELMTLEEIAAHTATNLNTVSSRLRLARKELRKSLGREQVKDSWRYRWTT